MSEERTRYVVGVVKIPHAERDVARDVFGDTGEDRGFLDVIGADTPDDHREFPVGSHCAYSVSLTSEEAERFADASNCRYVEEDMLLDPVLADPAVFPSEATAIYQRLTGDNGAGYPAWHGRDVPVAVLDQGTTAVVRNLMRWQLVRRAVFSETPPAAGTEIHSEERSHGCLVSACAIPAGGRLLDALVSEPSGGAYNSGIAAGLRWAAQNGAKIANVSFGGAYPNQVYTDAFTYMAQFGMHLYASAGNNGEPELSYPARYSTSYSNVHSIIAFDETLDVKASFSNWSAGASGCTAGVRVNGLLPSGDLVQWSGTSAASPLAANLAARLLTGAKLTPAQAATLLEGNIRDTGEGERQGKGAFSFRNALEAAVRQYGLTALTANKSLLTVL